MHSKKSKTISKRKKVTKHSVHIVECIVRNSKSSILLLKRSKNNSIYVNKWQLPGGKTERGETALEAIKREVWEETGCMAVSISLIKRIKYSQEFRGKHSVVMLSVFEGKLKGKIVLSEDHIEHAFFDPEKIKPRMLAPVSSHALFSQYLE